jgi:hypothetical protein
LKLKVLNEGDARGLQVAKDLIKYEQQNILKSIDRNNDIVNWNLILV